MFTFECFQNCKNDQVWNLDIKETIYLSQVSPSPITDGVRSWFDEFFVGSQLQFNPQKLLPLQIERSHQRKALLREPTYPVTEKPLRHSLWTLSKGSSTPLIFMDSVWSVKINWVLSGYLETELMLKVIQRRQFRSSFSQ